MILRNMRFNLREDGFVNIVFRCSKCNTWMDKPYRHKIDKTIFSDEFICKDCYDKLEEMVEQQ